MSLTLSLTASGTYDQLVVDYGYEQQWGGNRRYGQYRLYEGDANVSVVSGSYPAYYNVAPVQTNMVLVDDRDLPLFNNYIASGTVSVVNASFGMVELAAIGSGTIAAAGSNTSVAGLNLTGGYDVKVLPVTALPAGVSYVVSDKTATGFNVALSSGTASGALTFNFAVLQYNTAFNYVNDQYTINLVGKLPSANQAGQAPLEV